MKIKEGRILLWLTTVSCFTQTTTNTLQKLSEFQLLNDAIEEEAIVKLDQNIQQEPTLNSTNSSSQHEKPQLEPKFFSNKNNEELGMDTVTLIWYLTTFTALLGFFVVMACTENTCNRRRTSKPAETRNATPSPCPSYKHFAPPTYASVMKKFKDPKVFIVPVHEGSNSFFTNPTEVQSQNSTEAIEKNEIVVTVSR